MSDSMVGVQGGGGAWRLNPRVQLHWRHLSGEWLVFEVLSGQTHHLDAVAAAVLNCFEAGQTLTQRALLDLLDADYGTVLTEAQRQAALAAQAQWVALGMLVPATTATHAHAAV